MRKKNKIEILVQIDEDIEFELRKESKLKNKSCSDIAFKILKEWVKKKDDNAYHPSSNNKE